MCSHLDQFSHCAISLEQNLICTVRENQFFLFFEWEGSFMKLGGFHTLWSLILAKGSFIPFVKWWVGNSDQLARYVQVTPVATPFKMFICFHCLETSESVARSSEKRKADLCHENCWIVSQYYMACPEWLPRELRYLKKKTAVLEVFPCVFNCTPYLWKLTISFEFAVSNYFFVLFCFFSFSFLAAELPGAWGERGGTFANTLVQTQPPATKIFRWDMLV